MRAQWSGGRAEAILALENTLKTSSPKKSSTSRRTREARSRRRQVLSRVGDYVLKGPDAIYPPGSGLGSGPWLTSFLRLERHIPFTDPVCTRATYELPEEWKEAIDDVVLPVIRQAEWNRKADLGKAKTRSVKRPAIVADLFQVPQADVEQLERLITQLDRSLHTFPFEVEPASLLRKTTRPPLKVAVRQSAEYDTETSLTVRRGFRFTGLEMSCPSGMSQEFDSVFAELWNFLGTICVVDNKAEQGYTESWFLSPSDYSELLHGPVPSRR